MNLSPTQIQPLSPLEIFIAWSNGEKFSIPYHEIRFHCPCAGCIDEHTGQRTLQRSSIALDIRAVDVQPVGRYAVQVNWSDGHNTGIFHYDRLYDLSVKHGKKL